MRVLFVITARGGSKGIRGKNLETICGISLIGYKAISARKSLFCSRLIISTDSPEIQADARLYGVDVPFTRPAELATDTASSEEVLTHAMDWIDQETSEHYDAVMLLEPSSPFARSSDYDAAVAMLGTQDANAVVGIRETEVNSTYVGTLDNRGRITAIIDKIRQSHTGRRQDMRKEYTANGALYLCRWDYWRRQCDFYFDRETTFGYPMDRLHSVEIEAPIDLQWARFLAENDYIDMSCWETE